MELTDLISIHRIEFLEETEDEYNVRYGDTEYAIEKDARTKWSGAGAEQAWNGPALAQRLEQRLVPESGIFQDEDVPAAFKEVMMFHEIREQWYVEQKGLETTLAHELTLNDEVLYVLKFFDEDEAQAYMTFAERYREERRSQHQEQNDESEYAYLTPVYALLKRIENGKATPDQHQEFYFLTLTEHQQAYDKMMNVVEQTGQKPTQETLLKIFRNRLAVARYLPHLQGSHVLEGLWILKNHFGFDFNQVRGEIQAEYNWYNRGDGIQQIACHVLELYKQTGIPLTLAQIRKQRTIMRQRYDESIRDAKREPKRYVYASDLKEEKSYYLAAFDKLAADVRQRK